MSDKQKRRYYWLKLKENFFEEDTIEWLEEQPNGKEYCLFYLKLCLKSLKTEGLLVRNVGNLMIPYDPESLAKLTNSKADTVKVAMDLFNKIGLIEIMDSGEIYLNQLGEMVGTETESARQKRLQRSKEDNVRTLSGKGRLELEKEKEIEKELDIDKEIKNIYIDRFESLWKQYPKKTQKKKAIEQFKKKIKNDSDLNVFEKGYFNYLKYIEITDWYHPQELFRWIRDERYKDEYDLAPKVSKGNYRNNKHRIEEVPSHINTQPNKKEPDIDWVAEAERSLAERGAESE